MIYKDFPTGRFYNEDCFEAMEEIPNSVIDMIMCDLPYGTTQNKWDSLLPLDKLWAEYWRICKSNAVIVLTCAQPFTSLLIMSQINNFKYDWVWKKPKGTGHLNAKKMPMKNKEDIAIFYKGQCCYNPQMTIGEPYSPDKGTTGEIQTYGKYGKHREGSNGTRYPLQIQDFSIAQYDIGGQIHPTQKPIKLFEYLIKTYTNENDLILDNTAGSGTTAIAAINTNRKWVCIEKEKEYYNLAIKRIEDHIK